MVQKGNGLLMPEDEDCKRPACADTVSMLKSAMARSKNTTKQSYNNKATWPCPPGKDELGSSTWTLLHTMSAWYPDNPTKEDEAMMKHMMDGLARFYPCTWCAADFQENVKKSPVRTETRESLVMWMCEQHNIVNVKIGKPTFPCSIENLDLRWRKGDPNKCKSSH